MARECSSKVGDIIIYGLQLHKVTSKTKSCTTYIPWIRSKPMYRYIQPINIQEQKHITTITMKEMAAVNWNTCYNHKNVRCTGHRWNVYYVCIIRQLDKSTVCMHDMHVCMYAIYICIYKYIHLHICIHLLYIKYVSYTTIDYRHLNWHTVWHIHYTAYM